MDRDKRGNMKIYFNMILFFLLVSAFLSCKNDAMSPDFSHTSNEYERWKAYGLKNYTIEQKRDCFCVYGGDPVRVIVKDGVVVDAIRVSDSTSVSPGEQVWYKTVDELFSIIQSISPDSVAQFRVAYDSMYGYPKEFYVDPDAMKADEEYGYRNEKLVKIN